MDTEVVNKILDIQDAALHDEPYKALLDEHKILNKRFLDILPTLTQEQYDTVMDYIGLFTAMHLRMLELACLE